MAIKAQTALGDRVRAERLELEWTLEDLAERMEGTGARDASTLGEIERGEIEEPPVDVIMSLEDALDLARGSLEELVERSDSDQDARYRARRRNTVSAQGDTITIEILTEIGAEWWSGTSATSVAAVLAANPTAARIQVLINSEGGDVFETLGIMSLLLAHPGRVITTNLGKALSAGALLMQCGDERRASKASMMMIHRAWAFAVGNAEELEHRAGVLRKVDQQQVEILADKSNIDAEDIGAMLDAETWLTTSEQLEHGFIDTVIDTQQAAMACVRRTDFRHTPANLLPASSPPAKAEPMAPRNLTDSQAAKTAADAEQKRILTIQKSGSTLGVSSKVVNDAIDQSTSVADFNTAAIDDFETKRPPHVADGGRAPITAGDDAWDKWRLAMVSALVHKMGRTEQVRKAAKTADPQTASLLAIDDMPRQYKRHRLLDFATDALVYDGHTTDGLTSMALVARAFTVHGSGGYTSTGNFPVVLEEAIHKILLAAYELTADTWRLFTSTMSLSDFRPHFLYRLGEQETWGTVNEGGEFPTQAVPDGRREEIAALTKGRIMRITRQMIINDDLNTVARQAAAFGRAGGRVPEIMIYALLALNSGLGPNMTDGQPLFDASHKNISPSSALSVAGLETDRVLLEDQQDDNGQDFLALSPDILLISNGLRGEAQVINRAEFDTDEVAVNSPNFNRKPNKVLGLFTTIVGSPRAKAISATRRWLFANPDVAEVLAVGFLDGQQTPVIESRDGWKVDGTEWKGRLDIGVAAVDFKGAVTNAGS